MTDDVMTERAETIRALIQERERYAGWLTALEARRGATPSHVFDRVRTDYDGRLSGVRDRLAEHVGPLQEAEAALARQNEEIARHLGEKQDQLAELELRTIVGEFEPEDGERRVQEAAATVRELDGQRRSATDRLGELRGLIEQVAASPAVPASEPAAPAAPAEPTEPAPAPAQEAEQSEPPSNGAVDDAARGQASASPTPDARTTVESWTASVDDDGFVGTGQRLDALAASLGGAVAPPPAAAASAGQERTLRCQDCGEMNYPTEWYCERCGGELAAL
jgi:hypothetical protein